ncbi:MAG: four helix bundle protein [Chitinophagales bacterium]
MATIKRFEDLEAWQKSRDLAREVFKSSNTGSFSKDYKLKDQINSAAGSAMDNIAEGFGRGGRNEFVNFLSIAAGSIAEVKSQLYRAFDRCYITQDVLTELYALADEAGNKTGSLIQYLNRTTVGGQKFKDRTSLKN